MSIVIFILVLIALIVVHELGHFFAAKLSGMRVDEFGIGYPPRALTIARKNGTAYTLNWLPFGGFVKIFGEDPIAGTLGDPKAFSSRPRILQALTLVAGIAMNLVFAWVLLSVSLGLGTLRALSPEEAAMAPDAQLAVANVLPGSPAEVAGLKQGDVITHIEGAGGEYIGADPVQFTAFVSEHEAGIPLAIHVKNQAGVERDITVATKKGVVVSEPERAALGVGLATIGTVKVAWYKAPVDGLILTWEVTKETAFALIHFFAGIFTFTADLSQVAGPVGIAGAVGNAASDSFASLLSITALISINLALINLLPIPALDGGRLLFVIVEAITRKPINVTFVNVVNTGGFMLLVLLMLVITAHDIFKIVG
ncbi:MAG: metalloprotease RseP [Parcubacteria group bacterium]|nr:metalloprotease RseP [Parcubacteria group bacterium]